MTHSLTLGSLHLTDSMPADEGYVFSVVADGAGFGAPASVKEIITSLLSDGDIERIRRYGNREVTFGVAITGPSLAALAHGEAALRREVGRPNTLTWQAPDVLAVPTVFEVYTSEMSQTFNDLDELRRRRTFVVTLTCAPSTMSAEDTVVEALDVLGGSETIIDTCDSATGWTATYNGSPHTVDANWLGISGRVYTYDLYSPGPQKLTLTRTGTVSMTGTPYLRVNIQANEPEQTEASAVIGGVSQALELVSKRKSPANAMEYEFVFKVPDGTTSLTSLTIWNYSYRDFSALGVSEVARSGNPTTRPRQVSRILDIGGTERTTGSIQVASRDGSDLFVTMVHTSPASGVRGSSGYSPSMRPYRTSGNTVTSDAARFSGASEPLSPNPFVAQVPNDSLPDGPYFVAAMLKSNTTKTTKIYWTVRTITDSGSGAELVGEDRRSSVFPFTANLWSFVRLGVVSLPVAQSANAITRFDIMSDSADTAVLTMDDVFLFWAGDGCGLTLLNSAKSHLWLDTPDSDSLVPTYWTGDDPARADAHHPGEALLIPGDHPLIPGQVRVWAATLGTTFPNVSARYRKRWHSNAAE